MAQKEITIKVPTIKAHTRTETVYVCDICGTETKSISKCVLCGRDICRKYGADSCTKYDPHEIGDYPDKYCPICYGLRFEIYEDKINKIQEKADLEIEVILEKIKKESLEVR